MTTDKTDLDVLFAMARQDAGPDPDLTARVLADAREVQRALVAPARPPKPGWFGRAMAGLGGWQAASGVAMAGVAGLMIGVFASDAVDLATGGQLSQFLGPVDETSLMPGLESLVYTAWEG